MSKSNIQTTLIEVGTRFIIENGYNHTGLNEVLAAAGVPKGSFYYYFASKEDFGLEIIRNFDLNNKTGLDYYLKNNSYAPLQRLNNYFRDNVEYLVSLECRQGCLVGNLGQELSDQSDRFRLSIKQVMDDWADRLAECIKEAQLAGQIRHDQDAQALGQFCLSSWQGAILRMKIAKDRMPLDNFMDLIFNQILK